MKKNQKSEKLKILEVNKAYFPHTGGIETLVKQYSEELPKCGAVVRTLVCRDDFGGTLRERINGVRVIRSGSFGTFFSCPLSLSFILHFRRLAESADIIHINVPFPLADVALLLSGYKGKVAVSWHSDIVKQKKLMIIYRPFMKYLLKRADVIFTATEGHINGSDFLPEYRKKCRIIPYGITIGDYLNIQYVPFLTEKLTDRKNIKIFFTGRLVYYKGVDVLIKAFSKIHGCELFIAGTGELESELKNLSESLGLEKYIHFLGFLPDIQLKQAFADCDIFVLPSVKKSEAFGIVQLEAMVYGKPVVNTSLPSGVPYVSIHGETGLTVPPADSDALAQALNLLASDGMLREKLGKNASERIKKYFNEKDVIKKLYHCLSEVTQK